MSEAEVKELEETMRGEQEDSEFLSNSLQSDEEAVQYIAGYITHKVSIDLREERKGEIL